MDNLIDCKAVAAPVSADVADDPCALEERTGVRCGLATNKPERTCGRVH
jgi:hypothetical protein